jgi:Glycosyl transferase family 2
VKLAASLIVRNEIDRFLKPCIEHLLGFCDTVIVLDDGSDDGTREWLLEHSGPQLGVAHQGISQFYVHEGRARQRLLDITLRGNPPPTHVLSIDADEFISDGAGLRALLDGQPDVAVWALNMEEIWVANSLGLGVREDGGWRTHPLPVLWKAPPAAAGWRMVDKKLACRRVPQQVLAQASRSIASGLAIMHFGWADPATRQARYDRYAKHDGGRFHASRHLQSILWEDARVKLRPRPWPVGHAFDELRERFSAC